MGRWCSSSAPPPVLVLFPVLFHRRVTTVPSFLQSAVIMSRRRVSKSWIENSRVAMVRKYYLSQAEVVIQNLRIALAGRSPVLVDSLLQYLICALDLRVY